MSKNLSSWGYFDPASYDLGNGISHQFSYSVGYSTEYIVYMIIAQRWKEGSNTVVSKNTVLMI
jgi:hypothetical protein